MIRNLFRVLWQRIISCTKRIIDEAAAANLAATCTGDLEKLLEGLKAFAGKADEGVKQNILKQSSLCARATDILATAKKSSTEQLCQDAKLLEEAIANVKQAMDQDFYDCSSLVTLLDACWKADSDSDKRLKIPRDGFEFEVLPTLQSLTIEGACTPVLFLTDVT